MGNGSVPCGGSADWSDGDQQRWRRTRGRDGIEPREHRNGQGARRIVSGEWHSADLATEHRGERSECMRCIERRIKLGVHAVILRDDERRVGSCKHPGCRDEFAKSPGTNVATIYGLSSASTAYLPSLSAAPNDWTLFSTYSGGGMNGPSSLSIDSRGNVWVANYFGVASLFSNAGTPVFASGLGGNGLLTATVAAWM